MQFVSDPSTSVKIQKMNQRVRWQDPLVVQRGIDQTRLSLDGNEDNPSEFSFMVIGDSGSGAHHTHNPQRAIAEKMLEHRDDCRFILHTGDVVYLVGSSEFYGRNFIEPYREFLVGGEQPKTIAYDRMVFNLPFLPVLGNHDYYDLPRLFGLLAQTALPIRRLLQSKIDFDVGWHGSEQGNAYARAFMDCLSLINPAKLEQHLDRHYIAQTDTGRCLQYEPKVFTRLPNRYYMFRQSGIDFFALDSNTFNAPLPLSQDTEGDERRQILQDRRVKVEQEKQEILKQLNLPNSSQSLDADYLDDLRTRLEHLEESGNDIDKQLNINSIVPVDQAQLDWLQQRLIASWHTEGVRGRVIFFHHPPYVTEATKWDQAQTLAIRCRLRQVLNRVVAAVGKQAEGRPIVDLVLNGHAHCFEYLRTGETGHGDAHINWLVCGGSGYSLRRQRPEGTDLTDSLLSARNRADHLVARSHLFIGRTGQGLEKRRPYSFARIDVKAGTPPKFVVRPLVAERYRHEWVDRWVEPFEI
ncbi:MAG: metallophosphoesterase [Leptolyngbyaceae cyanobacterium CRU_2_3]|nr:metallophosphoesterase [Leptolyngbyaceae cyanobacterium CRU_2_3]